MRARCFSRILIFLACCTAAGCSPIPSKYLRDAEPNVTLTMLRATPQAYRDKLVVMGAVILEAQPRDGALWLHVRNRPLDQDYRPQLPPSTDDPEGGWYWVVVGNAQTFPKTYPHWGDMVVVGRMTSLAPGREPILKMVYVKGRGMQSAHDGVWEDLVDANYLPSIPAGAVGEMGVP